MTTIRPRKQTKNHQMNTLEEHLAMFKRRQEQLRRRGNLTLKEALDKVNDPKVYRRSRVR